MRRAARRGLAALALTLGLAVALAALGAPGTTSWAQPVDDPIGYVGPSYENARSVRVTAEKPESKLWWNDGQWWADLYQNEARAHHIFRLDRAAMTWVDTGVELDDRNKAKADILWDEPSQKLYVASHRGGDPSEATEDSNPGRLYRYSYVGGPRAYQLDAGFPVIIAPGPTRSLTIARDSTGRLWITYVWGAQVVISHTEGGDRAWSEPYVLPVPSPYTAGEDLSAVIAFGGDKIGVAWGDQVGDTVHFAVHYDGAPDTDWQQELIVGGDRMADNHLNLATDGRGSVYLVTKTSAKRLEDPLILLHVRTPDGVWSSYEFGARVDKHTRPIVLVDEENDELYVFATAPERGGTIYCKRAKIGAVAFDEGLGTPILRYPGALSLNDVTSSKGQVNGLTDLVILASDGDTRRYYYNLIPLRQVDREPLP